MNSLVITLPKRSRPGFCQALVAVFCLSIPVSAQETDELEKLPPSSPPPPESIAPLRVEPGIIPFNPTTEPGIIPLDGTQESPSSALPGDIFNLGEPISPTKPIKPEPLLLDEMLNEPEPVADTTEDDVDSWFMMDSFDAISGRAPGIPGGNFGGSNGGFESYLPFSNFGGPSTRRGQALTASLNLAGTYDSNPSRGFGGAGVTTDEGDFITTLGGSIGFRRSALTLNYGFNYSGSYNIYANNSDLNGYNQSAGAFINYSDGPLDVGLRVGLDYGSGANRFYASTVDEIRYNLSLNARYRISPKTSLTGSISPGFTNSSGNADTESTDMNLAALWRYSARTEFGPGIRYTVRSGSAGDDRTTIGPTLNANYRLSGKVSLAASVGADFVDGGNGISTGPSLSSSVSLNYRASSLWGMNLSYLRDSQASISNVARFEDINALRLGYQRRIRRATWQLGMSLESRSTENPDPANLPNIEDRTYLSFDTSLGMQVFTENTNANLFLRYNQQDGSPAETYDAFQIGFGLGHTF